MTLDDYAWTESTYPSGCTSDNLTPRPVTLNAGRAALDLGGELVLKDSFSTQLNDGHDYHAVVLDCIPGAGRPASQVFVFTQSPSGPRLIAEPIVLDDGLWVVALSDQDLEGLVATAYGWSDSAAECCADQAVTLFMDVTPSRIKRLPPEITDACTLDDSCERPRSVTVQVPRLAGLEPRAAERVLLRLGLTVQRYRYGPGWLVRATTPGWGARVKIGSAVSLWTVPPARDPQFPSVVPDFGNGAACGITSDATYVC